MRDRFRNCLLGGAIGDALGWPVEFWDIDQIRSHFGPEGLWKYVTEPAPFTDDTQMTLFTAEGLLAGGELLYEVQKQYFLWLRTQESSSTSRKVDDLNHPLLRRDQLWRRMAPGNTCLHSLVVARETPGLRFPINHSKGCGGVMRVAPVGLARQADAFRVACDIAKLTHGHVDGWIPAGFLAEVIAGLVHHQQDLLSACKGALDLLPPDCNTRLLVERAIDWANAGDDRRVEEIGEGWTGDEAIAIAVYCALRADDFDSGLRLAVNHSGDTDSTGAIYGNLAGAAGLEIDEWWVEGLELSHLVSQYADRLFADVFKES